MSFGHCGLYFDSWYSVTYLIFIRKLTGASESQDQRKKHWLLFKSSKLSVKEAYILSSVSCLLPKKSSNTPFHPDHYTTAVTTDSGLSFCGHVDLLFNDHPHSANGGATCHILLTPSQAWIDILCHDCSTPYRKLCRTSAHTCQTMSLAPWGAEPVQSCPPAELRLLNP